MRPLVFRPNEMETIYLEENSINWSEYCHKNIERDMKNHKYAASEKFQMPSMMVIIGVLLLLLAISNMFTTYLIFACYGLSIFSISFGVFSVIGVIKRNV